MYSNDKYNDFYSPSMSGSHYTRILLDNAYNFRLSARQSPLITVRPPFVPSTVFINWPFFNGLIWTRNRRTTSSRLLLRSKRRSFAFQWSRKALEWNFNFKFSMNSTRLNIAQKWMKNMTQKVFWILRPISCHSQILMRSLFRTYSVFVVVVVHSSFFKFET